MINRIPESYANYRDFKIQIGFKEYSTVLGIFLRIFRRVKVFLDENEKKHYIRKRDLEEYGRWDALQLENPEVDTLLFPEEYDSLHIRDMRRFIDRKLTKFRKSGLTSCGYRCVMRPFFTVRFHLLTNGSECIFFEATGHRTFDMKTGEYKRLRFIWPKKPETLGITKNELQALIKFMELQLPNLQTRKYLGVVKIRRKKSPIPLSVLLSPDPEGYISSVILLPRGKIVSPAGTGSFKIAKHAYDLTRGESLVKKYVDQDERGIIASLGDQKRVLEVRVETQHYIMDSLCYRHYEARCDGDIFELIYEHDLTVPQKLSMMGQLLKILSAFHRKQLDNEHLYYHGDVKPENILYILQPNREIKLFLTDFGFTNLYQEHAGTTVYISPEHALRSMSETKGETRGQELDVWALGLLLAALFKGSDLLAFLNNIKSSYLQVKYISQLQQTIIDKKIDAARKLNAHPHVQKAWDIIKKMLVVDPDGRTTAEEALSEFRDFEELEEVTATQSL